MPRKREQEVFKYQELSSEAKEKARDHYRESMFDADHISEQFKSILVERGFKDSGGAFDVNWSLGYCQGDGVCFWGHIDLPTFFKWALKGDDPKDEGQSGTVRFSRGRSQRSCTARGPQLPLELHGSFSRADRRRDGPGPERQEG